MFIFAAIFEVIKFAAQLIAEVIKVVMWTIEKLFEFGTRYLLGMMGLGDAHPVLDFLLFGHLDLVRAIIGQNEKDKQRDKEDGGDFGNDDDNNGIPDAYDRVVDDPSKDFLHLKYPQPDQMLIENDYVRFVPRAKGALSSPVLVGAKGIVRSEDVNSSGAYVMVKWNAFSKGEGRPAILHRVNQMDLHKLGHVNASYRMTQ